MRRYIAVVLIAFLSTAFFWRMGIVPMSSDYQRAWFEPWKSDTAVHGVPTITHKPVGDDVFRQIYPYKVLSVTLFRQGVMPLWNPYEGAGQPMFAVQHDGILNPFSVFSLFLTQTKAWTALFVGQFAVLAAGFMLYTASLGLSGPAVVLSTVILLGSAYVVANSLFSTYIYGFAGLPFLLWCIDKVLKKRKKGWVLLPVGIAWIIFTGFPQVWMYVFGVAFFYGTYRIFSIQTYHRIRLFISIALWSAFGLLISAIQLLPTYELFTRAAITADTSAFIVKNFLLPPWHYISVLIPNFFGNASTYNFWGPAEYTESASSVGSIAVFFAGAAFFTKPLKYRQFITFWVCVIIVSVLLSLRWFGSEFLYRLPIPVLSTGAPSRAMGLATVAFAVLSGIGIDIFISGKKDTLIRNLLLGVGSVLGLVLFVTFVLNRLHVSCHNPVILNCYAIAFRNTALETAVFSVCALAVIVGMAKKFSRKFAVNTILLVVSVSILYNAYKFVPLSKEINVMPPHPIFTALRDIAPGRVGFVGSAVIKNDFATYYRYYGTNYYDPLYVKRYGELVSFINTGDREKGILRSDISVVTDATVSADLSMRRQKFWDLTGTSALLTKVGEPNICRPPDMFSSQGCDVLWQDAHFVLYRRPTALPRVFLADKVSVVPDATEELTRMFVPSADLSKIAFVESPVSGWKSDSESTGGATIASYSSNRIHITTDTSGPMFLVLSDTDYPGWHANVDGKNVQVYRTDYAFRGVFVPKGSHSVEFYFDSHSFTVGFWITIITFIIWILTVVYLGRVAPIESSWYNRKIKGAVAKW